MAEQRTPAKIALLYAVTGCLWILFSDQLVAVLFRDPQAILWVSQLKGWGYVLVTSLLLYWLIRGSTQRLVQSEAILRQQALDLAQSREALQQAYAELEDRIADRTEALSKALVELQAETDRRLGVVEELREKDMMLAQQSRQAAMGEMIGNIAHQWRQPLNTLGLTIQQLTLFYQLGEFSREVLETSVAKSMALIKHMSRTIDDFRNFFCPDKEMNEFPIPEAVSRAMNLVQGSLDERQIAVEVSCQDEPLAQGYLNEYSQVLLNILLNARDAFQAHPTDSPLIRIGIFDDNGRSVVTITDNAGGIPPEILDKIFEPYFSTKGLQGTGIGLYMSKTIIERNMHGSLSARNTGDGAEFRIEV